jgi:L-ascorbate metabolism protein UlaG (beta-lactamase superfamily)
MFNIFIKNKEMKLSKISLVALIVVTLTSCKNEKSGLEIAQTTTATTAIEVEKNAETVKIIPITHGTLVLETEDNVIYVDPTGGAEAFKNQKRPTMVLITDIHGDHLDIKTLEALNLENIPTIVPQAVADMILDVIKNPKILNNGATINLNSIGIEAIPMYNLREEALKFHAKGRGNGYVLTINNERIYISGDTEDIPEMRNLKNIDKAFVCMNLPYTMPIENAASAVLDFKPRVVYPYHYRGTEGLSDVEKFKSIVNDADKNISVVLLDWYK